MYVSPFAHLENRTFKEKKEAMMILILRDIELSKVALLTTTMELFGVVTTYLW